MVSIKQPRYQEETSFEFGLPSIIAHFPKEHHYSFSSLYLSSAKRYTGWWENVCKNAFSCHRTACFPPHNILIFRFIQIYQDMKGSHVNFKVKNFFFSTPLHTTHTPNNLHSIAYHENNIQSPIRTYSIIALHEY